MKRRNFLKASWLGLLALAGGESAFIGLKFVSPHVDAGEFGGLFDVGAVDDFPSGSVTPFVNGRFYLVRLNDGGFLAVYRQCTHLGCSVPWNAEQQQFVCPCHGSAFERDGEVLNPPAPRPLDLFALTIKDGQIRVDTGKRIERDHADDRYVVYPEATA
ncbi:MAG: Rieske 2Fe-2S domain-containing protein [Anaerolineae bacterium]|nr:MAG: Rieske 2Fe-2S domain-containing protein [Anaerolineae bacterium]